MTKIEVDAVGRGVAVPEIPAQIDDLDLSRRRRRAATWTVGLLLALLVTLPLGLGLGPVGVSPETVLRVVSHHLFGWPEDISSRVDNAIIWQVRAPRVLLGAAVGGGLAMAGVVLQAVLRNVLADPYIIGVTSGASTGAAATILFGVGLGFGASALSAAAFVGALAASAAVFLIARTAGRVTAMRMLLAGVTVGYLFSAVTSFLVFASDDPEGARSVLFWLLGSLQLAHWSLVLITTAVVLTGVGIFTVWGRRLDAVAIGDDTALTLGVNPARFRVVALVVVALCVGVVVAAAGSIGFVGLVVPHVARRLVGGSHRLLVPVATLVGAVFLVWADVLARLALQPQEIPIGIITAVCGAPFLLSLVRRLHTTGV